MRKNLEKKKERKNEIEREKERMNKRGRERRKEREYGQFFITNKPTIGEWEIPIYFDVIEMGVKAKLLPVETHIIDIIWLFEKNQESFFKIAKLL